MKNERFDPKVDALFWLIALSSGAVLIFMTVVSAFYPISLVVMIPVDVLTVYLCITTLFGYVELREDVVFIKLGLIMKREIPYEKIRGFSKENKFYADSMVCLKNSFEHVNIKYNTFDMLSVSVVDNDEMIKRINERIEAKRSSQR